MPKLLSITIKSVCKTNPPHPHMGPSGFTQVQWHAAPPRFYVLHLPGGYFKGFPVDFTLPVPTSGFTQTLELVSKPPVQPITHYVYDAAGATCLLLDEPPDIIIDVTLRRQPKKKAAKEKKKK